MRPITRRPVSHNFPPEISPPTTTITSGGSVRRVGAANLLASRGFYPDSALAVPATRLSQVSHTGVDWSFTFSKSREGSVGARTLKRRSATAFFLPHRGKWADAEHRVEGGERRELRSQAPPSRASSGKLLPDGGFTTSPFSLREKVPAGRMRGETLSLSGSTGPYPPSPTRRVAPAHLSLRERGK